MCVDAEDSTNFLVVTLAVGGAAAANALESIHVIGSYLDGILDAQALALWGAVASILVIRIWNRLAGDDSSGWRRRRIAIFVFGWAACMRRLFLDINHRTE